MRYVTVNDLETDCASQKADHIPKSSYLESSVLSKRTEKCGATAFANHSIFFFKIKLNICNNILNVVTVYHCVITDIWKECTG